LEVYDAGGTLRGGHQGYEQQLSLHLGGGFDAGLYSVVVSLVSPQQEGDDGSDIVFAALKMALILQ
jgi:hypothetical protein